MDIGIYDIAKESLTTDLFFGKYQSAYKQQM